MSIPLSSLSRCFQGLIASAIATCAPDGTPNVTFLSQVYYVDEKHVALSCQFFNKTRRNVEVNPHARVEVYDPMTLDTYRLGLRYSHSETSGPLFDTMALRIQAIASVTGMEGIFRLIAADVYEVLDVTAVPEALAAPGPQTPRLAGPTPLTQVMGGSILSQQINRARDLDDVLEISLRALEELFGISHAMVLVPDETGRRLVTIASRGYGEAGVGAEVALGEGIIGTVAEQRRVLRLSAMSGDLRYGRAIRQRVADASGAPLRPEIPLPGLPGAQSQLALPLLMQDQLVGVLALESPEALFFDDWNEAFLQIIANQIAFAMDKHVRAADEEPAAPVAPPPIAATKPIDRATPVRRFTFYRNDDCVFCGSDYLIRNVPGKILWKLLTSYQHEGRKEFSNRELRLDPNLGLPALRDNLESRLVLLRRRLEQQCPDLRLISTGRGRFALEVGCPIELIEKQSS
ncbi:MAG TPA: GAF domain-containing protein [Polyangia bacterium]